MMYFKSLIEGISPLPDSKCRDMRQEIETGSFSKTAGKQCMTSSLKVDPVSAERIHPNDPTASNSSALEVFQVDE